MSADSPSYTQSKAVPDVDWEEFEGDDLRLTRRRLLTWAVFAAYGLLWAYDHRYVPSRRAVVDLSVDLPVGPTLSLSPNPTNVDWLFGLTIVIGLVYVVAPLYENPRMTAYYWREFKKNRVAVLSLWYLAAVFVLGIVGPVLLGQPELDFANKHRPPVGFGGTWEHPFGTARTGEGILEIVVVGMRISMQVGLIATTISVALATAVGATAAFLGGWVDEVLMRFVDLLLTFPTFFLILFLVYIYGGDLFLLILILSFTGWGGIARLVRSEALQRSEEAYIMAAEAAGASRGYIIRRHIVPNVSNTIITAATLSIPVLILFEAVIAFLGFGDPDVWSWGRIIASGRSDLQTAWWVSTIPGVFLFLTVLAFNFLGDALRDALDPRHEVRR